MRILVDLQTLQTPEKTRGIGLATQALTEALMRFAPQHQLFFVRKTGDDWEYAAAHPGLDGLAKLWDDQTRWQVCDPEQFMKRAAVDLLYVTSPLMFDIELPQVPRRVKVVCQVHDLIPLVLAKQYLKQWPDHLQADYQRRLDFIAGADLILCDSQATAADVRNLLRPKGDVAVSYLGPVGEFWRVPESLARNAVASHMGLTKPYVLAVSGWDYRKNNPGVIGGFAAAALPEHLLVVVGIRQPAERAELRKLAQKYGAADRLVFPDFVPADVYNSLYCAADLILFPTLYEGFGLPALEGFLCGVPVVAGNNSSLPEVVGEGGILVDVTDVQAIGDAIRKVATNPEYRAELVRKGAEQAERFTWERVANNIVQAFDRVWPRGGQGRTQKPRIAFFSPLNPQPSGISDYSEELLPYLAESYDIDLYTAGFTPSDNALTERFRVHDYAKQPGVLDRLMEYDARVYQMGNSTLHEPIYRVLRQAPGISVLHDYNLYGFTIYTTHLEGRSQDFIEEMEFAHGPEGRRAAESVVQGGSAPHDLYPCNRRVISASEGVLLHSTWGLKGLLDQAIDQVPLAVVRHGVPEVPAATPSVRRRLKMPDDALVLGIFGNVTFNKRVEVVLASFARLKETHPNSRLLIVGKVEENMKGPVEQLLAQHGLRAAVTITGSVSFTDFHDYMTACDICLNLRYPTMGETSGALLRMLAAGRPVVVSDVGTYVEYPDDIAWKVSPDAFEEELLTAYLIQLASVPSLRKEMGRRARAFVRMHHSMKGAAEGYADFIERVRAQRS